MRMVAILKWLLTLSKGINDKHKEQESRKHKIKLVEAREDPAKPLLLPEQSFHFISLFVELLSYSQGSRPFDLGGTTAENIKSTASCRVVSPSSARSIIIGQPGKGQSMPFNQASPSGAAWQLPGDSRKAIAVPASWASRWFFVVHPPGDFPIGCFPFF